MEKNIKELADRILADGQITSAEQMELNMAILQDGVVSPEEKEQINRIMDLIVSREDQSHLTGYFSGKTFRKKLPRGFTLLEMMIVVLIIGILLTLASFGYRNLRQKVYRVSCRENLRILHQAAVLCQTEHSEYEKSLTPSLLLELGYVKKVLRCPSGGQYAVTNEDRQVRITCFKPLDGGDHGWYQ